MSRPTMGDWPGEDSTEHADSRSGSETWMAACIRKHDNTSTERELKNYVYEDLLCSYGQSSIVWRPG